MSNVHALVSIYNMRSFQTHTHTHTQQQMPQQSNTVNVQLQDLNKKIPIQITLPPQHGSTSQESRVITIQVPASTLQGNQLQSVLGGSVITAAMSVPSDVATVLLQQHVDNVLLHQQQQAQAALQEVKPPVFPQYDGANDSSDDDDDDDDDDEKDDDDEDDDDDQDIDDDDDDNDEENEGIEDEPLNSGDDVSEEDPALFDTDNIVVCQYDKITRSRNKWKFYLKDGIMNLNGKDFVFLKANGDADW
uniref:Transcription initiation factor IIA subunit 1 n=1 Tax=Cacopsylla melanoneura TaxID=428564 RepID=A0A8D9AGL5_9HEMI